MKVRIVGGISIALLLAVSALVFIVGLPLVASIT